MSARRKAAGGGGGGGGVNLSNIITPFLDMSFQLLAFFIMTYHPSALEGHIDGKLVPPSLTATRENKPVESLDLPPDSDPDAADVYLVIVKSVKAVDKGAKDNNRHDGEPSLILLKQPQDAQPVTISDGSDGDLNAGLKRLETELKRLIKQPGAVKSNIKLEGDGDLLHMYVMRVYDVCRLAGFQNISFVAPQFKHPQKD